MFELSTDLKGPSISAATRDLNCASEPDEESLLEESALMSGPILGTSPRKASLKSVRLNGGSGDWGTECWEGVWKHRRSQRCRTTSQTLHGKDVSKAYPCRQDFDSRLHWLPIAALSLTQTSGGTPGWLQRGTNGVKGPHSPSPPEPSSQKQRLEAQPAITESRERSTNLLQRLADIPKSWLRYTRFRAAHSKAIMRSIPLLERAGIGALAGGLAGGITNATLHPIDTVKTKLQAKGGIALYSGPWDVVRKVLAKQGIRGFYRGLPAAVVGSVPSSAVYFGTYELGKELLLRLPAFDENRLAVPPVAAAVGNIASSAILVPKELVKQRLQAGAAGTARGVLASIVREEGFKGLYRGYSAALLRNVPSNVISFSTFEYLKAAWLAGSGETELRPWQSLLSGAIAGMLSAATTTPLDVVKTRLMTEARQAVSQTGVTGKAAEVVAKAQFVSAFTPSGVLSTLRQISADEGFKGLVRGAGPRIVYGGCFSAMGFLSFETAKHILLERYLRQKEQERLEGESAERVVDSDVHLGPSEAIAGPKESEFDGRLGDRLRGASLPERPRVQESSRR